jgi:hypothetical protein
MNDWNALSNQPEYAGIETMTYKKDDALYFAVRQGNHRRDYPLEIGDPTDFAGLIRGMIYLVNLFLAELYEFGPDDSTPAE